MYTIKFKKIRTRIIYWFLLLSLFPLLTALVVTYFQRSRVIEANAYNKLIAIRDLKVQQLNNWIEERSGDVKVIAGDYEIRGLGPIFESQTKSIRDNEKIMAAHELFMRVLQNYKDYEEVFFISAQTGLVEISTNHVFEKTNVAQDIYFTEPIKTRNLFIKNISYSKTSGKAEMTFSAPVFSIKNSTNIIGVLVVRIKLEKSLYILLSNRVGLGETGETLLVNQEGFALNELRWHENAPLNLIITAQPAVRAAAGETGIIKSKDYNNTDVLAAYAFIPKTNWGFVAKQNMKELNIPIYNMIWNFVVLFIISGIVIVLIAILISKTISKPIVEMNSIAKKIGQGDYSVRNTIGSEDELGSLANEFNNMAATIASKMKILKGIGSISETMIGKSKLEQFGNSLLKRLMKITNANMSTFYILNEVSAKYEPYASIGANPEMLKPFNANKPEGEFGNALSTKKIFHLKNIPQDTIFKFKTVAGEAIPKEIISIPIIVEDHVVALISLVHIQGFGSECSEILKQSWININTSYSNLLSGERTRIFAEQLTLTNLQLESQSEELQEQSEELQNQTEELQRTSEELQEQNLELEAQRNQVEIANNLKSEFLSNMSHELRTPLNSIMALSRVLQIETKEKLSEEETGYLEIVERNGKRLLLLINDILDLSKIEAGKMEIIPEFFSLKMSLQVIKENMQSLSDEKGLTLNLNVPENLPKIESDESRLHQVLTNIIGNAIKFTENGSVSIDAQFDENKIFIYVEDTGIGISKDSIPYIFDEFRQVDGTTSRDYEGTGLGLAIANKMIQILGGEILVKSTIGKGSKFSIIIPINWHEKNLSEIMKKLPDVTPNVPTVNTSKESSIPRILLVEDNPEAIIQVKMVLENENYIVDVANGGKEALEYIKHTIPNGIILDLMMPEIDGFEVLENIRSTDRTRNIPVLILTAKDLTKKDLDKLSANNIQQLIHKGDIDIDGLIRKVNIMMGKKLVEKGTTTTEKKELPKVLIIEDNEDNLITLKAILKGRYTLFEAKDGESGLEMSKSLRPDVILLDMSLPKTDGLKILSILKNKKNTKKIPVIAVTAQAMLGDREKFLGEGCDGYVSKPIEHEDLIKEINKLLNHKFTM